MHKQPHARLRCQWHLIHDATPYFAQVPQKLLSCCCRTTSCTMTYAPHPPSVSPFANVRQTELTHDQLTAYCCTVTINSTWSMNHYVKDIHWTSVGIRTGLRAGRSDRVQNGSAAHPASYPMGTRGSLPGGKAARLWSCPLTSI